MAVWKFQLLPAQTGILGPRYSIDTIAQTVADEVNDALPYRFRFHKIVKIVVWLGARDGEPDYHELDGVAEKQTPGFSVQSYADASDEAKIEMLHNVVREAFAWFEANFDDAQFITDTRAKLQWLTSSND